MAFCTVWKSDWISDAVILEVWMIKEPLGGVDSEELQFGPREPMKAVFPKSVFP